MAIVGLRRASAPAPRKRNIFHDQGKLWERKVSVVRTRAETLTHPAKVESIRISRRNSPMLVAKEAEQLRRIRDVLSLLDVHEIIEAPAGSRLDVDDGVDLAIVTGPEARLAEALGREPNARCIQLKTSEPSKQVYKAPVLWWNWETTGAYHLVWNLAEVLGVPYPEVVDDLYDLWIRLVKAAQAYEADRPQAQLRVARAKLDGSQPDEQDLAILAGGHWTVKASTLTHPEVWVRLQLATRVGSELHINQDEIHKYFA